MPRWPMRRCCAAASWQGGGRGVPVDQLDVDPDARWVLAGDAVSPIPTKCRPHRPSSKAGGGRRAIPENRSSRSTRRSTRNSALSSAIASPSNLGRNVDAKISSLRKINWESLAINFVMVFSPNTLQGDARVRHAEFPKGTDPAREGKVVQALSRPSPRHRDQGRRYRRGGEELLAKVMSAIRATAGVTLLIGAAVLAGAVAAGQQQRKYPPSSTRRSAPRAFASSARSFSNSACSALPRRCLRSPSPR